MNVALVFELSSTSNKMQLIWFVGDSRIVRNEIANELVN